jgi:Xaa-Pro aminopeptidase
VDLLLLTPGADLFYLTGFEHGHAAERLLALALRADGSATWIAPVMNVPQVEESAQAGEAVRGWTDAQWYLPALRDVIKDTGTIAFDDEARSGFLLDLIGAAPHAKIVGSGQIMRRLRLCKSADELAFLRQAAAQVDQTIPQAIAFCRPGRTEREVDEDLCEALRGRNPGGAVAFTIVASGSNAALPHHETAERRIEKGDIVILDFGTRVSVPTGNQRGGRSRIYGYHSDITVTCCVGEPADPEARNVYRVVYEAQQAAIAAVRPGATCEQIDRAARSAIEAAGYGQHFLHRTGHGLGLQVHEPPYLKSGNSETLEEGMVFSIEPGIYLPGRFGVRLEVIVGVGSNGALRINAPSSAELPIASA